MRRPELLIPASSLEVLKIAVIYGADAVYIGGEAFGLRAKAKNFSMEEIREGIAFAHAHDVKVYITANILAHNGDLDGVREYFAELREIKPDALIISDPGVYMIAKEVCPEIERHISTQANNTNYGTYRFWYEQGAKRVVSARELSLAEIKEIRANIPDDLEIETFIHGAMCISYSGRCLLSNYFTGRDANQGACTHPCRWKYAVVEEKRPGEYLPVYENERGTYIFNSKDLCMIEHIPELMESGIDSFKIEGRMKTALYVATVARTYRRAIDDYKQSPELYREHMAWYQEQISNCTYRQFTTGFFFDIIKPEIDFDPIADEHAEEVYDRAVENFRLWRERGWLQQDEEEHYYVYAQTMDGRTQYGLAMCCHFEDYRNGAIKKHELTRPDKEEDRMKHVRCQRANIEPVFFAYPDNAEIDALVEGVVKGAAPDYDFTAEDGFGHRLWVIRDRKVNDRITEIFKDIPALYVADGHHRTAAAARVGEECMLRNPNHRGDEEYCFFLAVTFPASQLRIIDYNRVVRDLNGMTPAEFVEALRTDFEVEKIGGEVYRPARLHNFAMYLDGAWYSLTAREGTYDDDDPIGVLDVTVLSNRVLDKLLDIKDLRTSKRIDFVGGIRGLGELRRRVDSGEMKVAFALYPVSMKQLIDIADTGNIMPPKTTWFEPKLRSGVVIHSFEEGK